MSAFLIRGAAPQDIGDIAECWQASFDDSAAFVREFLDKTGILESAVAAEEGGRVRSVMFAFDGLELEGIRCSYLYALCTHPRHRARGMGSAVVTALAERCFAKGAEMVFLSPADAALQAWYQRILGMAVLQCTRDVPAEYCPAGSALCTEIDAEDYLQTRRGGLVPTPQLLLGQSLLLRHYGGALLRIECEHGAALACVETQGEAALVLELCSAPENTDAALSAIAAHFAPRKLLLRQRSTQGSALLYLTHDRRPLQTLPTAGFPFTLG